jgi:hypothetical protein
MISVVSKRFSNYLDGRQIVQQQFTEIKDGANTDYIRIDNPPISSIISNYSVNPWAGETTNGDVSSQIWGMSEIYIPNYTNSVGHKVMCGHNNTENNTSNAEVRFSVCTWQNTAAITSITLGGGTWIQYTTAYLYGIKNS